jgi:mannose-6-phosphate isomerase-like protein (cupin superfamily)
MRRVVTGHTPEGKAVVVSDIEVDPIVSGGSSYMLWGADETPTFPDDGSLPPVSTFFPTAGGFRFCQFTIPPISNTPEVNARFAETNKEFIRVFPDFSTYSKKDNPAMHQTDTIDFVYIKSGEVWLELDEGNEVHLKAGDSVVQNGTRHAWINRSNDICVLFAVMIGAKRDG